MADLVSAGLAAGYDSDLESVDADAKRAEDERNLKLKPTVKKEPMEKPAYAESRDVEARKEHGQVVRGMDAWSRHKLYVNNYILFYNKGQFPSFHPQNARTDMDVLRENHRFLRDDEEDAKLLSNWEVRMAKKYYDKLFKEYAIVDLSRWKEGKVGMRWRVEKEVIAGKGQFMCGSKHCQEKAGLSSFEVPFAYKENKEMKEALVKVRVCPACAYKLNYKSNKAKEKRLRKELKVAEKKRRRLNETQNGDSSGGVQVKTEDEAAYDSAIQTEVKPKTEEELEREAEEHRRNDETIWKEQPEVEKSKDDEIDEYLQSMFP